MPDLIFREKENQERASHLILTKKTKNGSSTHASHSYKRIEELEEVLLHSASVYCVGHNYFIYDAVLFLGSPYSTIFAGPCLALADITCACKCTHDCN